MKELTCEDSNKRVFHMTVKDFYRSIKKGVIIKDCILPGIEYFKLPNKEGNGFYSTNNEDDKVINIEWHSIDNNYHTYCLDRIFKVTYTFEKHLKIK